MKNLNLSDSKMNFVSSLNDVTHGASAVVDLQLALDESDSLAVHVPTIDQFESWVVEVLQRLDRTQKTELTIRVVDKSEMSTLNQTYRQKSGPTNVLSFPFSAPKGVELALLGDIIICLPVIVEESEIQGKPIVDHWAHMVVHGALHLLGFDHILVEQAEEMENLEVEILARFKIMDPYGETVNT